MNSDLVLSLTPMTVGLFDDAVAASDAMRAFFADDPNLLETPEKFVEYMKLKDAREARLVALLGALRAEIGAARAAITTPVESETALGLAPGAVSKPSPHETER